MRRPVILNNTAETSLCIFGLFGRPAATKRQQPDRKFGIGPYVLIRISFWDRAAEGYAVRLGPWRPKEIVTRAEGRRIETGELEKCELFG